MPWLNQPFLDVGNIRILEPKIKQVVSAFTSVKNRLEEGGALYLSVFTSTGWSAEKQKVKVSFHLVWEDLWVNSETMYELRRRSLDFWEASFECRARLYETLVACGDDTVQLTVSRAQARALLAASEQEMRHINNADDKWDMPRRTESRDGCDASDTQFGIFTSTGIAKTDAELLEDGQSVQILPRDKKRETPSDEKHKRLLQMNYRLWPCKGSATDDEYQALVKVFVDHRDSPRRIVEEVEKLQTRCLLRLQKWADQAADPGETIKVTFLSKIVAIQSGVFDELVKDKVAQAGESNKNSRRYAGAPSLRGPFHDKQAWVMPSRINVKDFTDRLDQMARAGPDAEQEQVPALDAAGEQKKQEILEKYPEPLTRMEWDEWKVNEQIAAAYGRAGGSYSKNFIKKEMKSILVCEREGRPQLPYGRLRITMKNNSGAEGAGAGGEEEDSFDLIEDEGEDEHEGEERGADAAAAAAAESESESAPAVTPTDDNSRACPFKFNVGWDQGPFTDVQQVERMTE